MYNKILVTLDGSPLSEAVLPEVARLLEGTPITAVMLRVAKTPKMEVPPEPAIAGSEILRRGGTLPSAPAETLDQKINALKDQFDWYLSTHATPLTEKGIAVEHAVDVSDDDPADAIIRYARTADVDMIALASHGRTGISRLVSGSLADKLIAAGTKPIFVVRSEASSG